MIILTRLNGSEVGINADLIERIEASGDTVIALIDGTKYVVSETPAEVVDRIVEFRARVLAAADLDVAVPDTAPPRPAPRRADRGPLRLVVEATDVPPAPADGEG